MLLRRGSITVCLTSCLTGLDSTILVNNYVIQHKQSSWIVTSQTGGQPYSDTSTYKVSECSLPKLPMHDKRIGFSSQVSIKILVWNFEASNFVDNRFAALDVDDDADVKCHEWRFVAVTVSTLFPVLLETWFPVPVPSLFLLGPKLQNSFYH